MIGGGATVEDHPKKEKTVRLVFYRNMVSPPFSIYWVLACRRHLAVEQLTTRPTIYSFMNAAKMHGDFDQKQIVSVIAQAEKSRVMQSIPIYKFVVTTNQPV